MSAPKPHFFVSLVVECSCCGANHQDVECIPFTRPQVDPCGNAWLSWATCPTTGDPFLLSIDEGVKHERAQTPV